MEKNKVSLAEALCVMIAIIALMIYCIKIGAGLQIPLFLGWCVMFIFAIYKRVNYREYEKNAMDTIRSGFGAIMILFAVGLLIGGWIIGGTVPTLIYYGLKLINPSVFLVTAVLFCSILSLCTGTSYGTAGTGGLAMMGIGMGLGIPLPVTAGAVICGALFGDKLSPFSDTTNLSSAMAGADLFEHIKHMFYTTFPAYLITLVIFLFLGFKYSSGASDLSTINMYTTELTNVFKISPIMLLPLVIVIVLLLFKFPAVPTITIGGLAGAAMALAFQGSALSDVLKVLYSGFSIDSGVDLIDKLLNRGGITSMTGTALTMIFAMGLGGMLEYSGVLEAILGTFIKLLNSTGKLIIGTMAVSYITSAIGSTQAFAHVMTGKIFEPIYKERGLAAKNLSRTMEDSGTLGGVLIPWHTNAVFMVGALGVSAGAFMPYCFMSYLTPIIAAIYGFTGLTIAKIGEENKKTKASKNSSI